MTFVLIIPEYCFVFQELDLGTLLLLLGVINTAKQGLTRFLSQSTEQDIRWSDQHADTSLSKLKQISS